MSEELEVLKIVVERLNAAEISYLISGSIAANYYTIPRMTRDIDVVVELNSKQISEFVALFKKDFYVDQDMVREEVLQEGMFNLIHNEYVIKIDFIIRKTSEFQNAVFLRRKNVKIDKTDMWFISAEDLVLSKLLWAKDSHSEMQLKDVVNLIETVDNLDFQYIEKWLIPLGIEELYKEIKQ